jgi:hypothetical protein
VTVVAVTGHRELQDPAAVSTELDRALGTVPPPLIGISTLAAGADQLFAEAVLERGGTLEVIVPSADYAESLDPVARGGFQRLLARASLISRLPASRAGREAYVAAAEVMLERCDVLFAVWDGEEGRGAGGTADVIRRARERGVDVRVLQSQRRAEP